MQNQQSLYVIKDLEEVEDSNNNNNVLEVALVVIMTSSAVSELSVV